MGEVRSSGRGGVPSLAVLCLFAVGVGCGEENFAEIRPAQLSVEPESAAFQTPTAGSFEAELALTVKNLGAGELIIDSVTLVEDDDTVELAILDEEDWASGQKKIPGDSQEDLVLRWTVLDAQTDSGTLTIVTNGGTAEIPISTVDLDPQAELITSPTGEVEGQTVSIELDTVPAGRQGQVFGVVQSVGAVPLEIKAICLVDGSGQCVQGQSTPNGAFKICDGRTNDPEGCGEPGPADSLRTEETYTFTLFFLPALDATDTFVGRVLIETDAGRDPSFTMIVQASPCVRTEAGDICGTCGDGVIDEDEQCDDGNVDLNDACLNNCVENVCGDAIVNEDAEACDDGNESDTDGCLTTCVEATCGDSVVHEGVEECDDGNDDEQDECLSACTLPRCGDGNVSEGNEGCDDNNEEDGDGCSAECEEEEGFDCDGSPSVCESECGDGVVASDEGCDDGDLEDGDGCSAECEEEEGFDCEGSPSVCESECGDGVVASDEQCDDGDLGNGDGCSDNCDIEDGWDCEGSPSDCEPICGDGQRIGDEACDDGDEDDGDGCSSECEVEEGFDCEGEPSECESECGDGVVASDEGCDDGELEDGDGCSAECEVEEGFECVGSPSVCESECGDGIVASDEACDDGEDNSDRVPNVCRTDCTLPRCGDGVRDFAEPFGEECDEEVNDGCLCRTNCTLPVETRDNVAVGNTAQYQSARNLNRIRGNLTIRNFSVPGVEEPLGVECIEGDLLIETNGFTDLTILSNLVKVDGNISIATNAQLTSLTGLDNLREIQSNLSIRTNRVLRDIDGLGRIAGEVGGEITISNNTVMTNIGGLGGVTSVGGILLDANDLINVNGLANITHVRGNVRIASHPQLRHLQGLAALEQVDGSVLIISNGDLESAEGLAGVASIGGSLLFEGCGSLGAIALPVLESIDEDMTFVSNGALESIEAPLLAALGGNLRMVANTQLSSIDLSALTQAPASLTIDSHNSLVDLSGISNIAGVMEGNLVVTNNLLISSLDDFSRITGVEGSMTIRNNCNLPQEQANLFFDRLNPRPNPFTSTDNGRCLD